MNVLLIEADRLLAKNIVQAFTGAGHAVQWHVDPQSAITAADVRAPDLIILDFLLSNRSGTEFLYEFRSYPEWANVPAISYSSLSDNELKNYSPSFKQLGVKKVCYKSTTPLSELVDAARQLVLTPAA